MTSTSVKDVGNVLAGLGGSTVGSAGGQKAGQVSFQSVWSSQAGSQGRAGAFQAEKAADAKQAGRASGSRQAAKSGDSLKAKDSRVKDSNKTLDDSAVDDQAFGVEEQDTADFERAVEALGAAAAELMNRIADTFGVSVEEVQGMLEEQGLVSLDLLDRDVLSAFLLQAGGVEDSMALLTDESMYRDFRELMGELDAVLAKDAGMENGMSIGELKDLAAQMPVNTAVVEEAVEESEEPLPIEVTVETEDGSAENVATREDQTLGMKNLLEQAGRNADEAGTGNGGSRKHSDTQGEGVNPFLQNLNLEDSSLTNVQASEVTGGWDADTQDIMRQIMDYMRIQVKPDMSNLEMQLHPASLGALQISVAAKGGVVTASFIAQNEAVKAALESQMVQLKESFAEQGVKVEAIEVTVQTHQFEQNLEQGQGRNQNGQNERPRNRRLRLDGPLTMEELEDMDEEEQLAAQMMAANGSTVDYTA